MRHLRWILLAVVLAYVAAVLAPRLAGWCADRSTGLGKPKNAPRLCNLVRKAQSMRRVYELKPGAAVTIADRRGSTSYRVNPLGFRGEPCPQPKPSGEFRVAMFGGSAVFGVGLDERAAWPSVLGQVLRRRRPAHTTRVLNLGVPRSNTAMDVEFCRAAGPWAEPDVVVFYCTPFSSDMPGWMQLSREARYPPPRESLPSAALVSSYWDGLTYHLEPGEHTVFYWEIVGTPSVLNALAEARELTRSWGAEMLIVLDHAHFRVDADGDLAAGYYDHGLFALRNGCGRLGLRVVDLLDLDVALLRTLGSRDPSRLHLGLPDRTPVPAKVEALAARLADEIELMDDRTRP